MALSARSMTARDLIGVVVAIAASFAPAAVLSGAGAGTIVEEATAGFAGEKAGIARGDVILGWSRAANPSTNAESGGGQIETPFDLLDVEIEQAPRGTLTLIGRRGDADMRWTMPPEEWRVVAHPPLSAGILQPYQEGKRRIEAQKLEEGIGFWESAANLAADQQDWRLAGWLLLRAADVLGHDREQRKTDDFFARALELLDEERFPIENALALQSWADSLASRGLPHLAKERYERALRLLHRTRPESLAIARAWYGLGRAESRAGNDSEAEARHRQALMLREKLAPNSTPTADSLSALGMHALVLKHVAVAEEYLSRALSIREGTMGLAQAMDRSALAGVAAQRGDYMTALERLNPALSVLERLAPSSHELAYSLYMAGLINSHIGDLERAESYTRRALNIYRALSGNDRRAGLSLRLLSSISWRRRDFALAESLGKEALGILEVVAPRTDQVGEILHHLGDIALDRSDLPSAEEYFRRALAIGQERAPEGLNVANHLRCLGLTLARSGRLGEGEQHAARSAEIRRRLIPDSNELSKSLMALAEIARLEGRLAMAQERYEEALAIRSRVVPGSRDEAEAHHGLGWVHRMAGRRAKAAESFQRAIDALEHQRGKLGGTHEAFGSFTAAYGRYYQDAMENLVSLGRPDEAFEIVERARARLLLAMLAERDLMFPADLPPPLARERQLNQASYDRAQAELAQLSPHKDGAEIERLLARLRELRAEGAEISSRVRAASPRLASLHHPQPLNARAVASALDPGTTLLVFAVGEHTTLLYVVRSQQVSRKDGGLSVFTLPIGRRALRKRIESFRWLIASANPDQRLLRTRARELYDVLLRPADAILASSDHVAISPDGPLHVLPFPALVRTHMAGTHTVRRWVAEWRPVSIVASATHYAELKKIRQTDGTGDGGLVAFGDPAHAPTATAPPGSISDADVRRAPEAGADLGPLPFARQEVEAITALFGKRAIAYLGPDATEARAKATVNGHSYVHFACHAVLDEALPLNSALVLSGSAMAREGEDNGLLQVWEIFDTVRLDAKLVTLSGCQTALGEDMGGEGLMSLTRAFQYAGARSVLASLWRVPDQSTADLMVRFYGYLKTGHSKVDALRLAQRDLIRSGMKAAHPARWAAFALFGDSR